MTCDISITSFAGVGTSQNGGFQSVTVTASVSGCDEVSIEIFEVGAATPLLSTTAFTSGGTVTATLTAPPGRPLPCGRDYRVRVTCLSVKDCFADQQIKLPCGGDCCVDFTITPTIGPCVNGERQVDFLVSFTLNDPRCLPYVLAIDYGHNNSFSGSNVYTTLGSFSFQESRIYPSAVATDYIVSIEDSLHGSCPASAITLHLDACAPPDCCAITGPLSAQVGDCGDNCGRLVVLSAGFAPPSPPCGPATLQWQIKDQAGNIVAWNSVAFSTASASPNVQLPVELSAAGSPYVATLMAIHPTPCTYGSVTIIVPACNSPAKCPDNLSLSATDLGCQKDGNGVCARKYVFYVDAMTYAGCGQGATATQFNLSFGDGANVQFGSGGGGPQSFTFHHFYTSGGSPTATLSVTAPSGCQQTTSLAINVQKCAATDCATSGTGGGPPAIECVMCRTCQDYLAKIGASFWRTVGCKLLMLMMVLGLGVTFAIMATAAPSSAPLVLAELSTVAGVLIAIGAFAGMVAGFISLPNLCGNCCLYCAILAALVLAVILIIIEAIFGLVTGAVIPAIFFIIFLFYINETSIKPRCQAELNS
ncbi:hypothetical protein [Niveispirillum sp. KHB5.9]|uniref:hypothetical protein n=1 Tax=Niveispirillum sp. KHB5.9 TaxID=3400269 RepID=UPI003A8BD050